MRRRRQWRRQRWRRPHEAGTYRWHSCNQSGLADDTGMSMNATQSYPSRVLVRGYPLQLSFAFICLYGWTENMHTSRCQLGLSRVLQQQGGSAKSECIHQRLATAKAQATQNGPDAHNQWRTLALLSCNDAADGNLLNNTCALPLFFLPQQSA